MRACEASVLVAAAYAEAQRNVSRGECFNHQPVALGSVSWSAATSAGTTAAERQMHCQVGGFPKVNESIMARHVV